MAARRALNLACLVPQGRAGRNAEVAFAHANGSYLASRAASLLGDGVRGEIADALVSGCQKGGGRFQAVVAHQAPHPNYPAPADVVELEPNQEPCVWIGVEADGIWALPPRVADLERYFDTWRGAEDKPIVCVAPGDEFKLLRGMVEEVIGVTRPRYAQRIVFAASPAEGFELLEDLLSARIESPVKDAD